MEGIEVDGCCGGKAGVGAGAVGLGSGLVAGVDSG